MAELDYIYTKGIANLQPQQGDEVPVGDGSIAFNGGMFSNMRASKLGNTQFPDAQNCDIDQLGQVTTRRGTTALGTKPTSYPIQGLGYFDTPSFKRLVQCANTGLYYYDGSSWSSLISGYTASSNTLQLEFVQLVNYLYWVDGSGRMYRWNGSTVQDSATWAGTSMTPPPTGSIGIASHMNRIVTWGASGYEQTLSISDALSPNFLSLSEVVVGGGDGDPIVGCMSWISQQLLVFKRHSIWVTDTTLGIGAAASNQKIHNVIGCVSRRSIAQIGSDKMGQDVYFLARDGVRSVQTTIQSGQQGITPPISYPINDWMQRINWDAANTSNACYWNNRYMLAVPIDGATSPNYVFVYHIINQSWSGYWIGWTPTVFSITDFSNNAKLNFGDSTGQVMQWLDYVPTTTETVTDYQDNGVDIATKFRSKAYTFNQVQNNKLGYNVECEFFQSLATVDVKVKIDEGNWNSAILSFNSAANTGITFPITFPVTFPPQGVRRASTDLLQFGEFREIEISVEAIANKVALKTINVMAFIRTPQTIYGT